MNNSSPTIPLFDLNFDERETNAVLRVLNSKWLTMGPETELFEQEFAENIGVRNAIATSNCTTALHLANMVCGVTSKDEVICPALTFVATVNAILYAGGTPVFADVTSLNDWTINPEDIARKITPRTKAIMVMHYGGFACDMEAILEIAGRHDLRVIEDAAHGPGAYYGNKKLGTWGDVSCFSFFTNKNISTGEGGMICTDNDDMAAEIRLLRSHGMTSATLDRHKGHAFSYDVVRKGFNYRIDEIHSALGRVQLNKLDRGNELRQQAADYYRERLTTIDQISLPFRGTMHKPNNHIFPILLPEGSDRASFMQSLRNRGIQTSIHYPPVHRFSYYKENYGEILLPLTEEIGNRVATLPMFPALSRQQIDVITESIQDYFNGR
ncbi:MAG: UDP-4-amino-4-deoxy-L-arabinose--oxoglutarate aminotransferase [Syntrophus sp. SKADARSKE-3]|nr:UDP-4-amino-4-deoxy-L-arabinose--oxoglutarate aminotransferase [Syntrophus sp. SKADARSKE-3]